MTPPDPPSEVRLAKTKSTRPSVTAIVNRAIVARTAIERASGLTTSGARIEPETQLTLLAECAHVLDEVIEFFRTYKAHEELAPDAKE